MLKHNEISVRELTIHALTNQVLIEYEPTEYTIKRADYNKHGHISRLDNRIHNLLERTHVSNYCGKTPDGLHKFISEPFKHETHGYVYHAVEVQAKLLHEIEGRNLADSVAKILYEQSHKRIVIANGWNLEDFVKYVTDEMIPNLRESEQGAMADDFDTALKFIKSN